MKPAEMAKFERMVGNLPVPPGDMHKGMKHTNHGPIYMAAGRGFGEESVGHVWHCAYAFDYGDEKSVAQIGEEDGDYTLEEVWQQLFDRAYVNMMEFKKRDMLDKSFRLQNG